MEQYGSAFSFVRIRVRYAITLLRTSFGPGGCFAQAIQLALSTNIRRRMAT